MPNIRIESSNNAKCFATVEVPDDVSPSDLASIAHKNLSCYMESNINPNQVTVYKASGAPYKQGDPLNSNSPLYANHRPGKGAALEEEALIRLCILGPGAVGKSALTLRYTNNHFQEEYDPTIEDAYRKSIQIDGRAATLDILDTAGQEDFTALRGAWYRKKDGFLLIYAMNDRVSLDNLEQFHDQLTDFYDDNSPVPPVLLVGNKSDLEGSDENGSFWEKAKEQGKEWSAVGVMQTSAKTGFQVEDAFASIVRAVRRRKSDEPKKKKRWCSIL